MESQDATRDLLLSFLDFEVPSTNSVDFNNVFDYEDLRGGARTLLKAASSQRRTLEDGLSYEGCAVNPKNVVEAVNAYLSSVWAIQESLEYSAQAKIKLKGPLEFTWTSVLCSAKDRGKKGFTNQVFVFELSYVLVVRALSHYNNGFTLAKEAQSQEEDARTKFVESTKELRLAAGMLFLIDTLIFALRLW